MSKPLQIETTQYALQAFGQFLTEQTIRYEAELYSTCANDKLTIETIKRKYGQLEAYKYILQAFTELYSKGLNSNWKKNYLSEGDKDNEPDEANGTESAKDSWNL